MSVWTTLVGGLVATTVLTTVMRIASEFGLTRMDLPLLLGSALTEHRAKAKAWGYVLHFAFGLAFSLLYYMVFITLDSAGAALGALLGLLHAMFVGSAVLNILLPLAHPRMGSLETAAHESPLLEPPGFMMRNYGSMSPVVALIAHVLYGAIIGYMSAGGTLV